MHLQIIKIVQNSVFFCTLCVFCFVLLILCNAILNYSHFTCVWLYTFYFVVIQLLVINACPVCLPAWVSTTVRLLRLF